MAKKCHRLTGPLFWPSMLSALSFFLVWAHLTLCFQDIKLISVTEQVSLSFAWSETLRTGLLVEVQIISMIQFRFPQIDNIFFFLLTCRVTKYV